MDDGTVVVARGEQRGPFDVHLVVLAVGPVVPRPGPDAGRVAGGRDAGAQVGLELPDLLLAADGAVAGDDDRCEVDQPLELVGPPGRVALPAQRGGPEAAHRARRTGSRAPGTTATTFSAI